MIKLVGGAPETSNENTEIVLSLQDITGQLDDFLDHHHSIDLMRVMCPPAALYTRRGSNLAFPNYAPLPAPRINQMVIPTGASRWAYGLFLATEEQKDTIYQCQRSRQNMTLYIGAPVVSDNVSAGDCEWTWDGSAWFLTSDGCTTGSAVAPTSDGLTVGEVRAGTCAVSGGGITIEAASEAIRTVKLPVHCLPPRPVTPRGRLKQNWTTEIDGVSRRIENTADNDYPVASDLFIIPIVDIRYFWQYLHTGAMSAEDFTSDAGPFTEADFAADGNKTSGEKIFEYLYARIPDSLVGDGAHKVVGIDDLHPYYQTPPSFVSSNDYENLAVILDSFLWMHGLQLVFHNVNDWHVTNEAGGNYNRPYRVVSVQESDLIYRGYLTGDYGNVNGSIGCGVVTRNTGSGARAITDWDGGWATATTPILIAGGDNYRFTTGSTTILEGRPYPAKLMVALGDGTYSEESIPSEFTTHGSYTSLSKSISNTSAVCRYQWSEAISNEQLEQIVYDWYMRYYRQFDMTFAGIQLWQQSCYDDYMVVSMARCKDSYQCQTRVVSIALNHQADVLTTETSDGKIIAFTVISSDPVLRSALVEIRQRSFEGTVYGSTLGDTVVTVYDTDGCFLNEPNVDLTGRNGKAALMRTDDEAAAIHFPGYTVPEKYWNVLSLCCPNTVCE